MQISATLQNNFTTSTNTESSKKETTDLMNSISNNQANTTNTDAYNYVDLGEDISAYTTTVDPVQQQTNKELINYLSNIMNDKTAEGKKNLNSLDLSTYNPVDADWKTIWGYDSAHPEDYYTDPKSQPTKHQEPTKYDLEHPYTVYGDGGKVIKKMSFQELYNFLGKDYFGQGTSRKEAVVIADRMSVFPVTLNERQKQFIQELQGPTDSSYQSVRNIQTVYANDLHQTTKEGFDAIQLKKFKNLYSFSDAFAKTDKFQELYANYLKQNSNNTQLTDALKQGKTIAEAVGSKSFFTSQVGSQNLSKSEIIAHYAKISQDLKTLKGPSENTTSGEIYTNKINDSIKLYNTITNDLKKMWNYGDLDIKS